MPIVTHVEGHAVRLSSARACLQIKDLACGCSQTLDLFCVFSFVASAARFKIHPVRPLALSAF